MEPRRAIRMKKLRSFNNYKHTSEHPQTDFSKFKQGLVYRILHDNQSLKQNAKVRHDKNLQYMRKQINVNTKFSEPLLFRFTQSLDRWKGIVVNAFKPET